MSNSSTSPVRYPLPYKVVGGCLYKEVTTKSGITTKKLCNFLPYIVKEVSVDDGVEEKYELRLGGVHSSGRLLPEIDVSGSELGNFNWLIERWGADCVLEPERSIKETVRHAIQLTTENAEKIHVYHVTGWKNIDGKWEYLLPNDGKYDVSLRGKLSRYEKATDWKISDLSSTFSMTSEFSFAPDEITLPLLAFTFLTPLNEFLHQANCEPKFVLCLLGKTGTRKSTLAALFLSFYGRFSGSDLPLSFHDTANSIMYNAFSLNCKYYVDDGYSGANFNRPGYKQMMDDIYAGKVGTVIVKDQSRLGREYLQTGMLMEITFPQYDVRFIAINEKNYFQCGGYQQGKSRCTVHNIKEQVLDTIVLTQLKSMIALANGHSDEFYAMATEKGKVEAKKYYASAEKEKSQLTTRIHELDNIIRCLYEDRVVGRITPERYDFLASGYEVEQAQIRTKLNKLNEKINEIDLQEKYVKDFIAKAKEYINIEKLTPEILRAFIKRIDVYEKEVRYSRTCGNTIVIQYTFQLGKN